MLQPISTDTSDFPEMRRKGCVYVDKTAYLSNLLTGLDARFFSRASTAFRQVTDDLSYLNKHIMSNDEVSMLCKQGEKEQKERRKKK